MTKKHYLIIFITLLVVLRVAYFLKQKPMSDDLNIQESSKIDPEKLEIDGKKVVGLTPGHEAEEIQKLKVSNVVSPDWQTNLEESLRVQGGDAVKGVEIQKVDSFIWSHDGVSLNVESVIITVKGENNKATTFRALVDAQNGKILNNWDQPIIEYADPLKQPRIKIDPRYHGQ